ncbi:MAG: calcium-binding protein [Geminicoccaceae bacterium]
MAKITGTNGDDRYPHELEGTNLADQIFGLAGNDTLIGFGGDDVLEGGAGADELFGSDGFDYASYRSSGQGVSVSLESFGAWGGHAEGDQLYSIEGLIGSDRTDHFYGDSGRNILRGEGGEDDLQGGAGNDVLIGGAGRDILIGDAGADELRGDGGTDFVMYYRSEQAVTIDLATGKGRGGDAEGDRFFSVEAVQGSSFDDRIIGNGAANLIRGAEGADVLTGGGGADRFYIEGEEYSSPAAADTILDFSRSQGDKIIPGDAKADVAGFQTYKFIGHGEFTGVGQLRWYQEGGDTIIEGNTAVKEGAEVRIVLDGLVNLQASDFIFGETGFAPPIQS